MRLLRAVLIDVRLHIILFIVGAAWLCLSDDSPLSPRRVAARGGMVLPPIAATCPDPDCHTCRAHRQYSAPTW